MERLQVDESQVALCMVPMLHRSVSLASRAELGLSGFVLVDLWRMCAEDTCKRLGAPTGSTFWANQTAVNLQSACLAGVLVTLTKNDEFNPWCCGQTRLTELPIEEHFSFLRRQSPNAQLSARGYFVAGARVALKTEKALVKERLPAAQGEPALTEEQRLVLHAKNA